MIVTAWKNGAGHARGLMYGVKVTVNKKVDDRARYFNGAMKSVKLELQGWSAPIEADVTKSSWKDCSELRHADIGRWLDEDRLIPWKKDNPPKLLLEPVTGNSFSLRQIDASQ